MLSFLRITNLAILEDITLEPGPGLNVLTGETGAGKSIVVDAIGLLLGERGSADLLRSGADALIVEGQFDPADERISEAAAAAAGLSEPAAEIVIRRELQTSGGDATRSRAFLNGRIVSLATLKEVGESLADLHGQHQHQSLLRPEGQRDALDRAARCEPLRMEVAAACTSLRAGMLDLEELSRAVEERSQREEQLARTISEIESVAPLPGEEEELRREERLLQHAGEIGSLAGQIHGLLSDDDDSVATRLGASKALLDRLTAFDPQAGSIAALVEEARVGVAEASRNVSRYLEREGFDPNRLDQVAGRLADLQRLKRRYGGTLDEVIASLQTAQTERAALGSVPERVEALAAEVQRMEAAYMKLARELSERRQRAARELGRTAAKELAALAMEGTRLEILVDPEDPPQPHPSGIDRIGFWIAPNRGEALKPLARVASGGELSRLMLALRNAVEEADDARTLIFDEVDSGIGGSVADAVGQRLSRLARRHQVLCVTHLPQIAAFADRHFHVRKRTEGARTRATVSMLDEDGRVEEIARMLGGMPPETARRHAAAMVGRSGVKGSSGLKSSRGLKDSRGRTHA